jgi:hypothetical protein
MAGTPDWDWVSEKSVSALLIQDMSKLGGKKRLTTSKRESFPDLE